MKFNIKYHTIVLFQPHASFAVKNNSALLTEFDSIGLLSLSAYLKQFGYRVKVVHVARALEQGFSINTIVQMVKNLHPCLFGVSINWLHLSQGALELAEILKQNFPDIKIVAGGSHAGLFAKEIMSKYNKLLDGVAVGEGEETLLDIVERVFDNEELDDIAGLMTNSGSFTPRKITSDLNLLPLYTYQDIFPVPRQYDHPKRFAALNTTRGGCKKTCNFCLESKSLGNLSRHKTVAFSPERLAAQLKWFIAEGKDLVTIEDQISCHGDGVLLALIEEMHRKDLHLKHLSIFIEPGSLSSDVYKALEKAPVDELVLSFGIETGSQKVARNLNRHHDYQKIYSELEDVGKRNFYAGSWWMVGLPGETDTEIEETRKMIQDTHAMGIYPHSVSPLILFPQTELARMAESFNISRKFVTFDDFKKFSFAEKKELAVYPDLITHEMEYQKIDDTVRYLKDLKEMILSEMKFEDYLENKEGKPQTDYMLFRKNEIF